MLVEVTQHPTKKALQELHKKGYASLESDLRSLSGSWDNEQNKRLLQETFNYLDSIWNLEKWIMSHFNTFDSYGDILLNVKAEEQKSTLEELSSKLYQNLDVLIKSLKEQSEREAIQAQYSYNKITRSQLVLALIAGIIILIVVWSVIRYIRLDILKLQVESERDEINHQKIVIQEKNREILSSIEYAETLQKSMLPATSDIGQYFSDHLIFYKPRDIVSGDFYWFKKMEDEDSRKIYLAAADATGHGVPGAFVSFVCHSSLNRAADQVTEPGEILSRASSMVGKTFSVNISNRAMEDGMDIGLISLDKDKNLLKYAGAHNSAFIFRSDEMIKLPASRQAVGGVELRKFEQHEFEVQTGDMIYLFSDGYQDQFGGSDKIKGGKKFKLRNLLELLQKINDKPCQEQYKLLADTFEDWKGDIEQIDDVCIIGVRI